MKGNNRAARPVIIIGAHRSGTTATAHALELLGLQVGQDLDSHREPYALQHVHEDYLRRLGARWFEPEALLKAIRTEAGSRDCVAYLREKLRQGFGRVFGYRNNPEGLWLRSRIFFGARWGWKEPRTTLFAPAWLEIFPMARVLHIVRDPMAAARSIQKRELTFQAAGDRPSGQIAELDSCLDLVRKYVEAGEGLRDRNNYRSLQFEELQENPAAVLASAANFCELKFTSQQLTHAATTIRPKPIASAP